MSTNGTIVYVHGASDRAKGVREHVEAIEKSLAQRGSAFRVVAADWGDAVGPDLGRVLDSVPGANDPGRSQKAADEQRGMSRILQGVAGAIVAASYVHLSAPRRVRVWATDRLLHRRNGLMQSILGVADALVYQRAGDAIRAYVRDVIVRSQEPGVPLIALGNSLGGIILVDLLRQADAPRPDLLVTAGSQSSVMHAIGALGDAGAAPPFQPWLNIYDRRDLFAFVAEPVWPGEPGIRDHRIDLRLPFPDVHGPAYFRDQATFDAIFGHPALAEPPAG